MARCCSVPWLDIQKIVSLQRSSKSQTGNLNSIIPFAKKKTACVAAGLGGLLDIPPHNQVHVEIDIFSNPLSSKNSSKSVSSQKPGKRRNPVWKGELWTYLVGLKDDGAEGARTPEPHNAIVIITIALESLTNTVKHIDRFIDSFFAWFGLLDAEPKHPS